MKLKSVLWFAVSLFAVALAAMLAIVAIRDGYSGWMLLPLLGILLIEGGHWRYLFSQHSKSPRLSDSWS
jgi:hypothetical protein